MMTVNVIHLSKRLSLMKMANNIALVIFVWSLLGLTSAFQYSDLVNMNITCPPKDTCNSDKRPRMGEDSGWKKRNCFCDDLCAQFGDCCLDANAYNAVEQEQNYEDYSCVYLRQFGDLYMRGKCMDSWDADEISQMCLSGTPDLNSQRQDPLSYLPVTSINTGTTYTNFYCAICNNDSTSLEMWTPRVACPTLTSYNFRFQNLTKDYVSSHLVFNNLNWGLYIEDSGLEIFHICYIDPVMPETVSHMVRECKEMTKHCPDDWDDKEVEDLCQSYTAVLYDFDEAYRNVHCAICNNVPLNFTSCTSGARKRLFMGDEFNPSAFSLLFDFTDRSGSNVVGSTSSCALGEVFDPFFKKCRNVICGKKNQQYRYGRCIDSEVPVSPTTTHISTSSSMPSTTSPSTTASVSTTTTITTKQPPVLSVERQKDDVIIVPDETTLQSDDNDYDLVTDIVITEVSSTNPEPTTKTTTPSTSGNLAIPTTDSPQTLACEKFLLPEEEFTTTENSTVYVEKYQKSYHAGEYERRDGGILICIIQPETDKFSRTMGWVSMAGLGVSCICLLLHLAAFIIVPDLRNLSGKNLASLCLVLLGAYTTFILSVFGEPGKSECMILAAAMYYFFLASFCWMAIMAFDIWRTLSLATSELRVTAGKHVRKFLAYSIFGWLLPAAAVAALVTLDLVRPAGMPPQYYPALGERWCWFGHRKALLVFFAAPLTTIMVMNILLFILCARIIAETTQSTAKMTSCSPYQNQFKLYMRLALLMGLTWISGIVAGYLQLEPLWYIFVLLNTLQGVFIFMAFTCTRKVWHLVCNGCWRRMVLARRGASWMARSPSSSRQGLESRDSNDSQLSHASHSSVTRLTSNTRTSVNAF